MKFNEEKGNVFDLEETHHIVHCISMDFKLGAGIALDIENRYNVKEKLYQSIIRPAILTGNVINLVTKDKYWQKPIYSNIYVSTKYLYDICIEHDITKLVMPRIGCGLDNLIWRKVRKIIEDRFKNTDIEIEVRYL